MTKDVTFKLYQAGVRQEILKDNEKLQRLEYEYMHKLLGQIQAEFLQEFGFEGVFEFAPVQTDRYGYKIRSGNARTTRALNKRPGWLGQFVKERL